MAKKIAQGIAGEQKKRARVVSQFQQDLSTFKKDPMVSALQKARKQMFNTGDDGIAAVTRLIVKRIDELKDRTIQA